MENVVGGVDLATMNGHESDPGATGLGIAFYDCIQEWPVDCVDDYDLTLETLDEGNIEILWANKVYDDTDLGAPLKYEIFELEVYPNIYD